DTCINNNISTVQDCLIIEDKETVTLQAPKESTAMKNSEKGIGQSAHQFTFTQVFGPDTTQSEFFEGTMKEIVTACIDGVNGLVFTYGVTNAGKSFTVQGCPKDGGILPRSLDMIFNHIRGRQYPKMNIKPCFGKLTKRLNEMQVKQEEYVKAALLASLKEETENTWTPTTTLDALDTNSSSCHLQNPGLELLDLKWINTKSTDEACKILKIGNKNRSLACTRMNQQSSRRLALCDLAGSERCNKTHSFGDRLKEAGNINNSLLILGKCIAALKQNQNPKLRPAYIPFRESKLTRLFQPFFCGKGKACMIVNVNQCASTYDETLHVMKFAAVAKQVIQTFQPPIFDYFSQKNIGKEDKLSVHFDAIEKRAEDPELSSEEEEIDITILNHEDLLKTTEILKEQLVAERRSKLLLEVQIRKEMAEAMFQQLMETEEAWSKRLEDMKESYEDKLESKFEMYKEAIKKHAYMCAVEQIEEHYVSIEEFMAEQAKLEDREMKILQLKQQLGEQNVLPSESPNSELTEGDITPDVKYKVRRASDPLQRQCEEKDELIKSLKLKIQKLNETVQEASEVCRKAVEENNRLKQMVKLKEQEVEGLHNWAGRVYELEATVSLLQQELNDNKKLLSTEDLKLRKTKKGFFANLKYTVADVPKDPEKTAKSPTASQNLTSGPCKVKGVRPF
ncbi:hypothetical protein lerEdw1_013401, partial [Lerista edwardsae]